MMRTFPKVNKSCIQICILQQNDDYIPVSFRDKKEHVRKWSLSIVLG